MTLIERLEMAEKLALDRAAPSQICGQLHAIREELEAYELDATKVLEFKADS